MVPAQTADAGECFYCPNCDAFVPLSPNPITADAAQLDTMWRSDEFNDIRWVRRRRWCLHCEYEVVTAEFDESMIFELGWLRSRAAELDDQLAETGAQLARLQIATRIAVPDRLSALWLRHPAPEVPRLECEAFIEASAWWIDHPSGPVRAPGMAKKLEFDPVFGFVLPYGANKFAAAHAMAAAGKLLKRYIGDKVGDGSAVPGNVQQLVRFAVKNSVLNHKNNLYPEFSYSDVGGFLRFGVHGISISDATAHLLASA